MFACAPPPVLLHFQHLASQRVRTIGRNTIKLDYTLLRRLPNGASMIGADGPARQREVTLHLIREGGSPGRPAARTRILPPLRLRKARIGDPATPLRLMLISPGRPTRHLASPPSLAALKLLAGDVLTHSSCSRPRGAERTSSWRRHWRSSPPCERRPRVRNTAARSILAAGACAAWHYPDTDAILFLAGYPALPCAILVRHPAQHFAGLFRSPPRVIPEANPAGALFQMGRSISQATSG